MSNKFGTLLEQKRKEANLTIVELALITGLSEGQLEMLETGTGDLPNFDTCYRLGQALSSHTKQPFLLSALSEACRVDTYERKFAGATP